MTLLVTGATGNVGSQLVRELAERELPVRALVRDAGRAEALLGPAVELAVGDFGDPDSLRRALDGVEHAFLACGNVPGQVAYERRFVDAAQAAGVRRIVKLSTDQAGLDARLAYPRRHGEIEHHVAASGVPAVLLRPYYYMSNLLASADAVRHTGRLFAPAGGARIAMVHPRDIAAAAAVALTEDGHEGRTYVLSGPAAITFDDVARDLSEATGRAIEFVDLPDEVARQGMLEANLPEELVDYLVGQYGELRDGIAARTTDAVRTLTGREPRPFRDFAREYAAAFGAMASSR